MQLALKFKKEELLLRGMDDKTSNFLKAIDKYAKEQRKEIKAKASEFKKKELNKAEAEVLRDSYFLIQREMAQMRKGIDSKVSKVEIESKRNLLAKRKNIMEKVFLEAKNRLIDFTKDNDSYSNYLLKSVDIIAKTLNEKDTILYVKSDDLIYSEKLEKAYPLACTVMKSLEIKIGGILGYNAKKGLIIDETMDSKLKDQYIWFEENSNLTVV